MDVLLPRLNQVIHVYIVFVAVIGGMTLPSLYWNNILARIDRAVQPLVKNLEDTMHIKRKASKKGD